MCLFLFMFQAQAPFLKMEIQFTGMRLMQFSVSFLNVAQSEKSRNFPSIHHMEPFTCVNVQLKVFLFHNHFLFLGLIT